MSDLIIKTQDELHLDRIRMLQYDNLRKFFGLFIDVMLGDDYYNMANDVYNCDIFCFEDLINKYGNRKQKKKWKEFSINAIKELYKDS
jgi:hypothetical protein